MTARENVCAVARGWLGVREATPQHRQIIDVYNAGRPPGSYEMSYADPWCAAFVSAVGMEAGVSAILPGVGCDAMIADYKQRGQFVANRDYPAKPGDLIFYDWDGDGSSDHVGIIVEDTEHYYRAVEGNYSDAVKERTIAHGSKFISGFAVPLYGEDTNVPATPGQAVIIDKPDGAVVMPEPAAQETVTITLPVLRYGDGLGDPSDPVRAAQILLTRRGFRCGNTGADGEYGPKTQDAVKRFQRCCDLLQTGEINAETWTRLLLG